MLSDEKCWENSGFFHILYQYSITSYIKNFNETGKMTQWIGSYLPLSLMAWDQFLEPRWWREDLSCPLISMWVESREYLSWAPWSTPYSSLLSSIFHSLPKPEGQNSQLNEVGSLQWALSIRSKETFPQRTAPSSQGVTPTPFRRLNTRLGCQGIHFWPLVSWVGGDTCFLPNPYKFS